MKRLALLGAALFAAAALAAPDEELLGKSKGYPVCQPWGAGAEACAVGAYSHYDKLVPFSIVKAGAPRALKEAPKVLPMNADAFMAETRSTGLLVLKGDAIVAERYGYERKASDRFTSMSMAKTVVAMLMGVALSERKIRSIDDLAQDYVPQLKGQPYGETSLRHLLMMSSGVRFNEVYDGRDDTETLGEKTWGQRGPGGADTVATFTTRERPAGEKFSYSSGESQVLALVLRAAVKKPLADYLSEKIWQPMGAEADATWLVDRGGYETGYAGINATLRDWGRLGMLLANYGEADGRQLIPAEWIREATIPHGPQFRIGVASKRSGYGYQTWLIDDEGRFALLGIRGQAILVDPKSKVVVVNTAVHRMNDPSERAPQFKLFYTSLHALAN